MQKQFPALAAIPDASQECETGECLLSDVGAATRYGVSRHTVRRWRNTNPNFPDPVQILPGTTRGKLSELRAFEACMPVKSCRDQTKSAFSRNSGGK